MPDLHPEAKTVINTGVPIGFIVTALGIATKPTLVATGVGLAAAAVAVAVLFDQTLPPADDS